MAQDILFFIFLQWKRHLYVSHWWLCGDGFSSHTYTQCPCRLGDSPYLLLEMGEIELQVQSKIWLITEHKRKKRNNHSPRHSAADGLWKASLLQSVRIFMPLFTHSPSVCHHYLTLSLLIIAISLLSAPHLLFCTLCCIYVLPRKGCIWQVIINRNVSWREISNIKSEFCHWKTILGYLGGSSLSVTCGVPQGSVSGPFLVHVFMYKDVQIAKILFIYITYKSYLVVVRNWNNVWKPWLNILGV